METPDGLEWEDMAVDQKRCMVEYDSESEEESTEEESETECIKRTLGMLDSNHHVVDRTRQDIIRSRRFFQTSDSDGSHRSGSCTKVEQHRAAEHSSDLSSEPPDGGVSKSSIVEGSSGAVLPPFAKNTTTGFKSSPVSQYAKEGFSFTPMGVRLQSAGTLSFLPPSTSTIRPGIHTENMQHRSPKPPSHPAAEWNVGTDSSTDMIALWRHREAVAAALGPQTGDSRITYCPSGDDEDEFALSSSDESVPEQEHESSSLMEIRTIVSPRSEEEIPVYYPSFSSEHAEDFGQITDHERPTSTILHLPVQSLQLTDGDVEEKSPSQVQQVETVDNVDDVTNPLGLVLGDSDGYDASGGEESESDDIDEDEVKENVDPAVALVVTRHEARKGLGTQVRLANQTLHVKSLEESSSDDYEDTETDEETRPEEGSVDKDLATPVRPAGVYDVEVVSNDQTWNGGFLLKIPYNRVSKPRKRRFFIRGQSRTKPDALVWRRPEYVLGGEGSGTEVPLSDIVEIVPGCMSEAFQRQIEAFGGSYFNPSHCFSIILPRRTIDLIAPTTEQAQDWIDGLEMAVIANHNMYTQQLTKAPHMPEKSKKEGEAEDEQEEEGEEEIEKIVEKDYHDNHDDDDEEEGEQDEIGNDNDGVYDNTEGIPPGASFGFPADVTKTATSTLPRRVSSPKWRSVSQSEGLPLSKEKFFESVIVGRVEEVAEYLSQGWDVDSIDDESGDTALVLASRNGDREMVELCLAWEAKNDPHPKYGQTALQAAVLHHRIDIAQLLLLAANEEEESASKIVNHELKDERGGTCLHRVVETGSIKLIKLLLDNGASTESIDAQGQNPIHRAVFKGKLEILELLLKRGEIHVAVNAKDSNGNSPLHLASMVQDAVPLINLLLQARADPASGNIRHQYPFQVAAEFHHLEAYFLLSRAYEMIKCSLAMYHREASPYGYNGHSCRGYAFYPGGIQQSHLSETLNSDNFGEWPVTSANNSSHSNWHSYPRYRTDIPEASPSPQSFGSYSDSLYWRQGFLGPLSHHRLRYGYALMPSIHSNYSCLRDDRQKYAGSAEKTQKVTGDLTPQFPSSPHIGMTPTQEVTVEDPFSPYSARETHSSVSGPNASFEFATPTSARNAIRRGLQTSFNSQESTPENTPSPSGAIRKNLMQLWPEGAQEEMYSNGKSELSVEMEIEGHNGQDFTTSDDKKLSNEIVDHSYEEFYGKYSKEWANFKEWKRHQILDKYVAKDELLAAFYRIAQHIDLDRLTETSSSDGEKMDEASFKSANQEDAPRVDQLIRKQVQRDAERSSSQTLNSQASFYWNDVAEESGQIWEIHTNEQGYTYFFCPSTGVSQWEDPRSVKSDHQVVVAPSDGSEDPLSAGPECSDQDDRTRKQVEKGVARSFTLRRLEAGLEKDTHESTAKKYTMNSETGCSAPEEDQHNSLKFRIEGETESGNQVSNAEAPQAGNNHLAVAHGMIDLDHSHALASVRDKKIIESIPQQSDGAIDGTSAKVENPARDERPNVSLEAADEISLARKKSLEQREKNKSRPNTESASESTTSQSKPSAEKEHEHNQIDGPDSPTAKASSMQTLEEVRQDPCLSRYLRMAAVGVPTPSVVRKMKEGGSSQTEIDLVLRYAQEEKACREQARKETSRKMTEHMSDGDSEGLLRASSRSSLGAESSKAAKDRREELKSDDSITKYFKMLSYGVPLGNVKLKMMADQIPQEKIDIFCGSDTKKQHDRGPGDSKKTDKLSKRASVPLLKLHWDTIPEDKVKKSVWALSTADHEGGELELDNEEIKQLEDLFRANPAKSLKLAASPSKAASAKAHISLVDMKRANNVSIGLAQFKNISFDRLATAIVDMDVDVLNVEKLQNLQQIMPTEAELKSIRGYNGDIKALGKVEKFFLAISAIPRVERKLEAFLFREQFPHEIDEITHGIDLVSDACQEVINSKRLARVLQKLLAVGNVMNHGTYKGQAEGFTLDSLLKTTETKGIDKKTTVLDYVVRSMIKQSQEDALNFSEDLLNLQPSMKFHSKELVSRVSALENKLQVFKSEIDAVDEDRATLSENNQDGEEKTRQIMSKKREKDMQTFLSETEECLAYVLRMKNEMLEHTFRLAEYFGEDGNTCTSEKVFDVLLRFKTACERSSKRYEQEQKRISRRSSEMCSPQSAPRRVVGKPHRPMIRSSSFSVSSFKEELAKAAPK